MNTNNVGTLYFDLCENVQLIIEKYWWGALSWILAATFLGVAFIFPLFWWFCFFGVAFLLHAISVEKSYIKIFLYAIVVGIVQYASALVWFLSTFPVQAIPSHNMTVQFLVIGGHWIITSVVMGVSYGFFAIAVKSLPSQVMLKLICIPALFVFREVLSAFLFSVYSLGPGSTYNISFSFGQMGYLLSRNAQLVQISWVYGVYGLSFIAACLSVLLYYYISKRLFKMIVWNVIACCFILYILFASYFVHVAYTDHHKHVISIETYFDGKSANTHESSEAREVVLREAIREALIANPDSILLPEDARFSDFFATHKEFFAWAKEINPTFSGSIIDTGYFFNAPTDRAFLRAEIYNAKDSSVSEFDKDYLVPDGEFLSYFYEKLLSLFVSHETLVHITDSFKYSRGTLHDTASLSKDLPALLFCSESVSPFGVKRAMAARHPDFVAHVISHAWFTHPYSMWYQLDAMLVVQAVWNNVPIVSAANMAESKLYLPNGEMRSGQPLVSHSLWSLKLFTF